MYVYVCLLTQAMYVVYPVDIRGNAYGIHSYQERPQERGHHLLHKPQQQGAGDEEQAPPDHDREVQRLVAQERGAGPGGVCAGEARGVQEPVQGESDHHGVHRGPHQGAIPVGRDGAGGQRRRQEPGVPRILRPLPPPGAGRVREQQEEVPGLHLQHKRHIPAPCLLAAAVARVQEVHLGAPGEALRRHGLRDTARVQGAGPAS